MDTFTIWFCQEHGARYGGNDTPYGEDTEFIRYCTVMNYSGDAYVEDECDFVALQARPYPKAPFVYEGVTIVDPTLDETGRESVDPDYWYELGIDEHGQVYGEDEQESEEMQPLPSLTCGQELADGTTCRRPALHGEEAH